MITLDEILTGLSLDGSEFVNKLRALFSAYASSIHNDEPQPLDGWVPSTAFADGTVQLMPFRRCTGGFAMLQTASPAGAELTFSLDRLPRGARVASARLSYSTDATFPDSTNELRLTAYDKRTGDLVTQLGVPLPRAPTPGEPASLVITFPRPVVVGLGQPTEQQIVLAIDNAVNGASLFVRGLHLTYSFGG